ncbi:plasmid partitioning protein, partial [Streptomyces goshikiensis]|uniref:plasmid partitioning protein n=1 Tax=Streptomyces goshikiensis TaxID=1942 RepID=UPI0033CFDB3B
VLINGERRFRSALHVGLESLDFVVRDDLAGSRTDFIDHLLAENLEREDFDVIERARGVRQLVETCAEDGREHGAKSRAAERLGRSPSWVTNQLVLLELPDEIQLMLSSGDLPERDGRLLARAAKDRPGVGAAELLALLRANKEQEAQVKAAQKEILRDAQESVAVRAQDAASPARGVSEPEQQAQQPARLLSADKSLEPGEQAEYSAGPLSADKSREPESLPPMAAEEPAASLEPARLSPAPQGPTPSAPESVAAAPEAHTHEPESAIPSQGRGTEPAPVMWDDPDAVFNAIRQNMTAKDRAELTMRLIHINKRR